MAKTKTETPVTVTSSQAADAARALAEHFAVRFDPNDHADVVRVVLEGAGIQVAYDGDPDADTGTEPAE